MRASNSHPRTHLAERGHRSPIVYLPLTAAASDDRSFAGWAEFLALLPLTSDSDTAEETAAAGG